MKEEKISNRYEDIIDLPCPKSVRHVHMSNYDRAAQFCPFAALMGYDDCIDEAGRLTDGKIELDENEKIIIDRKIRILMENIKKSPEIKVVYFVHDEKKTGGKYVSKTSKIKKIDEINRAIEFCDKTIISVEDIIDISDDVSVLE